MLRNTHSYFLFAVCLMLPFGLTVAGCSNKEAPSSKSEEPQANSGGGRGREIAANATAADIFQQKCQGCHGDKGQGANGPNLTKVSADSDTAIFQTIHDGRGRMPAFGKQMTEAQLKELVAYVKQLGGVK
jgi:mono/diheme cytochrome c family protein